MHVVRLASAYMFLVGIDFNTLAIRQKFKSAGFVSLAGITLPFTLGFLLIVFAPDTSMLFNDHFSSCYQGWFLGVALLITAFHDGPDPRR